MIYGLKISRKEIIKMDLKKYSNMYGFIVVFLLGSTIAMEKDSNNGNALKTFRCPTIEEIHACATEMKRSPSWEPYTATRFTLNTKEGVIFKPSLSLGDINKNTVQRALNLTKYSETWCVEKNGSLKKILFRYFPDNGQDLILKVDLKEIRIDPKNISYPINHSERISTSAGGTKYIIFNDPSLIFTISE